MPAQPGEVSRCRRNKRPDDRRYEIVRPDHLLRAVEDDHPGALAALAARVRTSVDELFAERPHFTREGGRLVARCPYYTWAYVWDDGRRRWEELEVF